MGRHLWRLLHPTFLIKMRRTKAASLYGWDILFKGTFWSGPVIGEKLADIIHSTADAGHEVGLHAWDHHAWQANINRMDEQAIGDSLEKGINLLNQILGKPPICSAVPGWKCTNRVLLGKNNFFFEYNSDCRGHSIFRPMVAGIELDQPQIPVTLPTYDEVVGRNGITDENYNDHILSLVNNQDFNVLTIHAEVEGIARSDLFEQFLNKASSQGITFVPLGTILREQQFIDQGIVVRKEILGREGWISCQEDVVKRNKD